MKIKLISLTLINFKRVRQEKINFSEVTNISGENGTGKTTIFDAFLWLLFGKDSTDRKDFEIKTLDENNQPYHNLMHEVEGVFLIDGSENTFRRAFKEKWTKKRGSAETEFTGHETAYYWNDVPLQQQEFQKKISEIIPENIFKLITNTGYFSAMKWQDRRAVLLQMAGKIDNTTILDSIATVNNKTEIFELTNALNKGKTIEQFKSEIAAKKKKIKDELDLVPTRIEEANRNMPADEDFELLESEVLKVKQDIESIDGLLQNSSKGAQQHQTHITHLVQQKGDLQRKAMQIENDLKNKVNANRMDRQTNINNQTAELNEKLSRLTRTRTSYTNEVNRYNILVEEKKTNGEKYSQVNAETLVFESDQFNCPACKREFEASNIEAKKEELTKNFNKYKSDRLYNISTRSAEIEQLLADLKVKISNLKAEGEGLKTETDTIRTRIEELEKEHQRLITNEVDELANLLVNDKAFQDCKNEIDGLEELINQPYQSEDNTALKERKNRLTVDLQELNNKLATKGQREKVLKRIEELQDQEQNMAQELAIFEGTEYCIEQFNKAHMNILSDRINGRFNYVSFKLFEEQINGGEAPCCEILINGVPYSDANTASKINAGLDIINTLSDHYGVFAPVFVDNAESVNDLIASNTQIIRLVVSRDPKLKIESASANAAALN